MRPDLTIGMATHSDFDGVYFTIQSLRLNNADLMPRVEFVIIDNSPATPHGEMIRGLAANVQECAAGKYVPMTDLQGTSRTRDRIFAEATGDAVLVMDCHVLLWPGALRRLMDYHAANPQSNDLLSGPIVYDDLKNMPTHFDDEWGGEMWGRWGVAWQCGCGPDGVRFSIRDGELNTPGNGQTYCRSLAMGDVPITLCGACGKELPQTHWAHHEKVFEAAGFQRSGLRDDAPPFEIPGMGLGLFSCRREAWLGFHPEARGFGGEEMYIHEKYRRAGHKSLCLPFLKWNHRFGRANGIPYPLTRWNKVRNYVLEFHELGRPLDVLHREFVESKLLSEEHWKLLESDPIGNVNEPTSGCNTCGGATKPVALASIDEAYEKCASTPRDLDQHMPKLRELAARCPRVTEFSGRRESAIAFLAGEPERLVSYNTERDGLLLAAVKLAGDAATLEHADSPTVATIEETDLLFLDTRHTHQRVAEELRKFAPATKRFIVLHDTQIHGETGEDGKPGIMHAVREFLRENPQWSVVYHTAHQYGLTVLGCQREDKPKLPGKLTMAVNFTKATAAHVADGLKKVDADQYEQRLLACSACDQRVDDRCAACGCFLSEKAAWRSSDCPLSRWPRLTQLEGAA